MKRGIITNNGHGIHISDGEVWMTTWELADLFYTTAGAIHAAIKRILKTNILKSHEVCKYIGIVPILQFDVLANFVALQNIGSGMPGVYLIG